MHGTKSGVIAAFIPPVAWYRSIELFWHDRYSATDGNKDYMNDVALCVAAIVGDAIEQPQAASEASAILQREMNDWPFEYSKSVGARCLFYGEAMASYWSAIYEQLNKIFMSTRSMDSITFDEFRPHLRGLDELLALNSADFNLLKKKLSALNQVYQANPSMRPKIRETIDDGMSNTRRQIEKKYNNLFQPHDSENSTH